MATVLGHAEIRVDPQGRLVIPSSFRKALGVESGDSLIARLEDGRLILEKRETVLTRVRARFSNVPTDARLVDELIRERREEARREVRE